MEGGAKWGKSKEVVDKGGFYLFWFLEKNICYKSVISMVEYLGNIIKEKE